LKKQEAEAAAAAAEKLIKQKQVEGEASHGTNPHLGTNRVIELSWQNKRDGEDGGREERQRQKKRQTQR